MAGGAAEAAIAARGVYLSMTDEQRLEDIRQRLEECRAAGGEAGFEGWFGLDDIEFLLGLVAQGEGSIDFHEVDSER